MVYTGEAVIAEQMSFPADAQHSSEWGFVNWKHEDPVTGSYSRKRADGSSPTGSEPLPNAEVEPLGGRIPDEDPYDPTIPPPAGLRDFRYNGGDVFRPEYGCIVDGFLQDGPGLCTLMPMNGSGEPDRRFQTPSWLGYWRDEEDPNPRRDPNAPPGTILAGAVRTVFVPLFNLLRYDNQSKCDSRLAQLFGDGDSVVGTATEPPAVDGNPDNPLRNRLGAFGEDPTKGVMHLFSNATGTPQSGNTGFVGNLYTPVGYSNIKGKADDYYIKNPGEKPWLDTVYSNIQVTYAAGSLADFGYKGNLTISFIHAGPVYSANRVPSPIRNGPVRANGTQLIGTIGADGSPFDGGGGGGNSAITYYGSKTDKKESRFIPTDYIHNHVIFYRRKGGRLVGIDPRSVFCHDLGF